MGMGAHDSGPDSRVTPPADINVVARVGVGTCVAQAVAAMLMGMGTTDSGAKGEKPICVAALRQCKPRA